MTNSCAKADHDDSDVEALLRAHPDVASAVLLQDEAADGREYPVAYVVPAGERMRLARLQIELDDRAKRITQWQRAFDQVYRSEVDVSVPTFVGWTNSYTGEPLPEHEMREWLDATVDRIRALRPRALLEIGCGVGLLVRDLAPACESYRGTDLSPVAIGRLQAYVNTRPEMQHVKLTACEADDLASQASASVDTVVVNSVVQYFPDVGYLRRVLAEAMRVTAPGGRIFIGDVRHLNLLPLFHGAVQLARAPADASVRWLKRRIALAIEQDRELSIDPQLFLTLADADKRIDRVEVLLKRGRAHNELTRYRYDVVIHLADSVAPLPVMTAESRVDGHALADLVASFEAARSKAGASAAVCLKDVPNLRLATDLAAMRTLAATDDRTTVAQLRAACADCADRNRTSDLDPDTFWTLADELACDTRVGFTPGSVDGCFDVMLFDPCLPHAVPVLPSGGQRTTPSRLATDPLEVAYRQQLGLDLQRMLGTTLSEAARPAAVLAVSELPQETAARSTVAVAWGWGDRPGASGNARTW